MRQFDQLAFLHYLKTECGYHSLRPLGDGRWAGLFEFMFTWAIITGRMGEQNTYEDRWCYHTRALAEAALESWDGTGEPDGWHRHPATDRRREIEHGRVSHTRAAHPSVPADAG